MRTTRALSSPIDSVPVAPLSNRRPKRTDRLPLGRKFDMS